MYANNSKISDIRPYVPGRSISEIAREYNINPQDIIKLSSNENPHGMSPIVRQKIADISQDYDYNLYPDALSESLTAEIRRHHNIKDNIHIVAGNGMDNVLEGIGRMLLDPDVETIICHPTFGYYDLVTRWMRANPINIFLSRGNDYAYDMDAIISAITPKTRLIYICSPNNPTGNIMPWHDVQTIHNAAMQVGAYVFVDEAYIEYSDQSTVISHISTYTHLIVGRTFSKAYGLASFRLGWGAMHSHLADLYARVQTPFSISGISMQAGIYALQDQSFLDYCIQDNAFQRIVLLQALMSMGCQVFPSQANFICFGHMSYKARDICQQLLQRGIIVRDITKSFLTNGHDDLIRVTIGTADQNQKFIAALMDIMSI